MATPKTKRTPAPAPAPASAPAPAPAEMVTANQLNMAVETPIADEAAIAAVANPELPGQIPGQTPPPAPEPSPASAVAIPPASAPSGDVDASGAVFDPAMHDAKREKNGEGLWKKKRGRKNGGTNAAPAETSASRVAIPDAPGQSFLPGMEGVAAPDRFDISAEMYCQTGYAIFGAVFSAPEDWQPDSPGEHANVKKAVASYLRFKQTEDLPPGMALALAVGTFAVPRLMRQKTKEGIAALVRKAGGLLRNRNAPENVPAIAPAAPTGQTPANGFPAPNE